MSASGSPLNCTSSTAFYEQPTAKWTAGSWPLEEFRAIFELIFLEGSAKAIDHPPSHFPVCARNSPLNQNTLVLTMYWLYNSVFAYKGKFGVFACIETIFLIVEKTFLDICVTFSTFLHLQSCSICMRMHALWVTLDKWMWYNVKLVSTGKMEK